MYYIHPIPDCIFEVLETLENDILKMDDITRLSKVCNRDFEILKN